MLERKSVDCLLVGQTPPPYHGQAIVTGMLFEHRWSKINVALLRMAYSDTTGSVGKFSLGKIAHLFKLIFRTWLICVRRQPRVLYYLPASANTVPVVRDIIYLVCTRWLFRKTVFHFHAGGLPNFLQKQGLLKLLGRIAYGKPDVAVDVIETNPPTGVYFRACENVVVRNGVDVGKTRKPNRNDTRFTVIFVGILNEGKGVGQIIETAKLMKDAVDKCRFVLVGDWASDAFKVKVTDIIECEELEKFVTFTGSLQGEDKWQCYADADCMLFPSHYEAETFGMVLIEAMAYGLPVVTTKWRGIPKVLGEGDCGYLCDIKSPHQYAACLRELMEDSQKFERMSKAARERYEIGFTREKFLKQMEDLLARTAGRG